VGPVPWHLPRQCCYLTSRKATTLSVLTLCHLEERQWHHTHCKSKVVMLLSFARCGPSALAPSSPMLSPDIAHKQPHYQYSHCATWKNANGTTHIANPRLSCCRASPGVDPVPWRLPCQCCCLTSHTSNHSISTHTVPPGRTPMTPRTVQAQGCHVAELRQVWAQCLCAFLANLIA